LETTREWLLQAQLKQVGNDPLSSFVDQRKSGMYCASNSGFLYVGAFLKYAKVAVPHLWLKIKL